MNLMKLLNMETSQVKVPLSLNSHLFQLVVVWVDFQVYQDRILEGLKLLFLFHLIKEPLQNYLKQTIDLGNRQYHLFYL